MYSRPGSKESRASSLFIGGWTLGSSPRRMAPKEESVPGVIGVSCYLVDASRRKCADGGGDAEKKEEKSMTLCPSLPAEARPAVPGRVASGPGLLQSPRPEAAGRRRHRPENCRFLHDEGRPVLEIAPVAFRANA